MQQFELYVIHSFRFMIQFICEIIILEPYVY